VQLVADGDLETALERIEKFGGQDKEGLQRQFILYMLCLMELTLLDSKEKLHAKSGIDKLLKHFDEKIPTNNSNLINWVDFFPIHIVFQVASKCIDHNYLVLFNRTKPIKPENYILNNKLFYSIYKKTFFLNHELSIDYLNCLVDIAENIIEINTLDGYEIIDGTDMIMGELSENFRHQYWFDLAELKDRIIFLYAKYGRIEVFFKKIKNNYANNDVRFSELETIKKHIQYIIQHKNNIEFLFDFINKKIFHRGQWENLLEILFKLENLGHSKLFESLYSKVIEKFKSSHFAGSPSKEYSNVCIYFIQNLIDHSKIDDAIDLIRFLDEQDKKYAYKHLHNYFYTLNNITQSNYYFQKLDKETQSYLLKDRFKDKLKAGNVNEISLYELISKIPSIRKNVECLIELAVFLNKVKYIEEAEQIVTDTKFIHGEFENHKGSLLLSDNDYLIREICEGYIFFDRIENIYVLCSKMNDKVSCVRLSELIAQKGHFKLAYDIASLILTNNEIKWQDYNNFCKALIEIINLAILHQQNTFAINLFEEVKLKSKLINELGPQYKVLTRINKLKFQLNGGGIVLSKISNIENDVINTDSNEFQIISDNFENSFNLNSFPKRDQQDINILFYMLMDNIKYNIKIPKNAYIKQILNKLSNNLFLNKNIDFSENNDQIVLKIEDFLKVGEFYSAVMLINAIQNEEIITKSFILFDDYTSKIDDSKLVQNIILEVIPLFEKDYQKMRFLTALTGTLFKNDLLGIPDILRDFPYSFDNDLVDNCYIEISTIIAEWCCFDDAEKINSYCYSPINKAIGFAKISQVARENGFWDDYNDLITKAFEEAEYIFEAETDAYQLYEWRAKAFLRIFSILAEKNDSEGAFQAFKKVISWSRKISLNNYWNGESIFYDAYTIFLTRMNEDYISSLFKTDLLGFRNKIYTTSKCVINEVGFKKANKILRLIDDESDKNIFKMGLYDSVSVLEDENIFIEAIKDKKIGIDTNESLILKFSLNQLFFSNLPQEKLDRYNRTLNLQWAIDIKNQLPN
jgi:hypothetical protein